MYFMKKTSWMRPEHNTADIDRPFIRETPEEFLARGGRIVKCPPRMAIGPSMYTPTIVVDGHELPVSLGSYEYLPNFVRDLTTYDAAQEDRVTPLDDGSTDIVRRDERRAIRSDVEWRERQNKRSAREGADVMEEAF